MDAARGEAVLRRLPDVVWKPRSESRSSSASSCASSVASLGPARGKGAEWLLPWLELVLDGLRAGAPSFGSAAAFNGGLALLLKLLHAFKRRRIDSLASYLKAIVGVENVRFAAMVSLWSFLYRITHGSLQLSRPVHSPSAPLLQRPSWPLTPATSVTSSSSSSSSSSGTGSSGSGSNSSSAVTSAASSPATTVITLSDETGDADKDPQERWYDGYVAGAVSGLAIAVETRANRVSMAQQVMVRGLQGSLHGLGIPHAAVLVFGLACGQIMYASLNRPETLPPSYVAWVRNASHASPASMKVHGAVRRGEPIESERVAKMLLKGGPVTAKNASTIRHWLAADDRRGTIPCAVWHPWSDSHAREAVKRFFVVTRWVWPVYLTLTMLPTVTLRFASLKRAPLKGLLLALFASVRSSCFLGAFVFIFQALHCVQNALGVHSTKIDWLIGFATCLSLFVDDARRRTELAVYVAPRGAQSAWAVARQKRWLPRVPAGEVLLGSAGLSLIMGTYTNHPDNLAGVVRRIVSRLID